MKKALFIAYYYPPISDSGSNRSIGFTVRLGNHGWKPVVLTVDKPIDHWIPQHAPIPDSIEIHRTTEKGLLPYVNRVQSAINALGRAVSNEQLTNYSLRGHLPEALREPWTLHPAGPQLAQDADLLYVSSGPYSASMKALGLKRKCKLPLVVDFRDPWSFNHLQDKPNIRKKIQASELEIVQECDRLILNTPGAFDLYESAYPQYKDKFRMVTNGYDEVFPANPDADSGRYTIKHVGAFYGDRTPDSLLSALATLDDDRVEFVQVGPSHPSMARYEDKIDIRCTGMVPRAQALAEITSADLLYLKQGAVPGMDHNVAIAAKTFEYLTTGIPILVDCPPGDNADLVSRYPGNSPNLFNDTAGIAKFVEASLEENQTRAYQANPAFLNDFSRDKTTEQLVAIFNELSA